MTSSGTFTGDLSFNPDGSAVNPRAFQKRFRHDYKLMAQLIKTNHELAAAVLGNDLNKLQDVLRELHYPCSQVSPFVDMQIGDVSLKALVDIGVQSTIMAKSCAERCGLLEHLDVSYKGIGATPDGDGRSKVLGLMHKILIKIKDKFYPCSFLVLDSPDMEFLNLEFIFGLDMLQEHKCTVDFENNVLRIGEEELSVPLLQEKDVIFPWMDEGRDTKGTQRNLRTTGPDFEEKVKVISKLGFKIEPTREALKRSYGNEENALCILVDAGISVIGFESRDNC